MQEGIFLYFSMENDCDVCKMKTIFGISFWTSILVWKTIYNMYGMAYKNFARWHMSGVRMSLH